MIFITILLIFLLGMAFCQWIVPLIDSLFAILLQYCEVVKGNLVEKTTISSLKIAKLNKEAEETNIAAIGFVANNDIEEAYSDDESF